MLPHPRVLIVLRLPTSNFLTDFGIPDTILLGENLRGVASMLRWAVTFFIIALIAGLLGFTGIAGAAVGMARILFFVFVALFVLSLIFGPKRRV